MNHSIYITIIKKSITLMKSKNIRAKLKHQSLNTSIEQSSKNSKEREINDMNKSSEVEISFNITPEEDELKKSINLKNYKASDYKSMALINSSSTY